MSVINPLPKGQDMKKFVVHLLRCCAHIINKPFSYICNCSLEYGIHPDRFKYLIVNSRYKKDDKTK
jgi:hypothetical protein